MLRRGGEVVTFIRRGFRSWFSSLVVVMEGIVEEFTDLVSAFLVGSSWICSTKLNPLFVSVVYISKMLTMD